MSDYDEKAARIMAQRTPPAPMPAVGDELPEGWGSQREAVCECGRPFTQTKATDWVPKRCETCRGVSQELLSGSSEGDTQARMRLAALNVPPRYQGARLDTFALHGEEENRRKQNRLLIMARRYLSDWPHVPDVIVFRGGPGTGKGHLAWSIAIQLVALHDVQVRVVKLGDAIRDLREAWRSEGGPSEADRLSRYRQPHLLIIDEVSRHAFYGEPHRHLYDLIDHRIEYCRPTILTTNETREGLAELLLPALTSRVAGTGLWEFGDVDYRLRRAA